MIYATITEKRGNISISAACKLFGISRDSYYHWLKTKDKPKYDADLRDEIEIIVLKFPGYGHRRVTEELKRRGYDVGRKRVLRIMRQESLLCQLKRAWVRTTDSDHTFTTYPNLAKDLMLTGINQLWVSDITYIRLPQEFVYLAVILDAFSRKVVGWHLSRRINTDLCLKALEMALGSRDIPEGLIHHSDRGVQYAAGDYVDRLQENNIQISMSRKGNPYDNAKAESFFKTLKTEEVYLFEYETFGEANMRIGTFIEDVYNQKRLHSSLGYLPPSEFEEQLTSEVLA